MKRMLILLSIILIISLSTVSASENITTEGNFTELNCKIQEANETLILDKDYSDSSEMAINKSITIDGNGYSINNGDENLKLNVSNDVSIIFKNITFKSNEIIINNENSTFNLTVTDCIFKENPITDKISNRYYAGEVSETIRNTTYEIVGNLTGLEAAKILAKWVGINVKHETAPGFYQTPEETLKRRIGNCCSQTDLFLHMCEAIGLEKEYKMYYVHVGNSEFGSRHFFAMINGTFIDVDSKRYNPWGNAATRNNSFYCFTEYPNLPIARAY